MKWPVSIFKHCWIIINVGGQWELTSQIKYKSLKKVDDPNQNYINLFPPPSLLFCNSATDFRIFPRLRVLCLIHTKCFCYSAQIICQRPKEMSEANNCLFQESIDHIRKCESNSRHRINLSYSHSLNFFNNTQLLRKSQSYNGRGAWEIPRECVGRLRAIRKTPREEPQCDLACERDSGVPPSNESWRRTRGVW